VVRADLLTDAAALLRPDWLAAQRWFGARDRSLAAVSLADAAPLPRDATGGPEGWLLVVTATFADGREGRYLVPAVGRAGEPLREPADGDGAWRAVAGAVMSGGALPGRAGSFLCEPLPALGALAPGGADGLAELAERRLGVEQSNTSATIGDRLILKVYRRLEVGENPEIEMGTFLESVACPVAPRMAGSIRYESDAGTAAAAMLQERVAGQGDAWSHVLARLGGDDGGPGAAVRSAATIGRVTAQLHASLAARPHDAAFPVRPATPSETQGLLAGALGQLEAALAATASTDRERLGALAPRIRAQLEAAFGAARVGRVTRVHGDYHLGQLLRTADGFAVIDFEGEPARSIAERRMPQPPERDLAGMLRSFDYAVRTVARGGSAHGPDPDAWLAEARGAFLAAYADAAPSVPDPSLLRAFELDKACYEVRYEAANRPDWTWLPLDALERLA
jgi:maltokinase